MVLKLSQLIFWLRPKPVKVSCKHLQCFTVVCEFFYDSAGALNEIRYNYINGIIFSICFMIRISGTSSETLAQGH